MTIDKDEGEVTDEDEGAESEKKKNNKKVITSPYNLFWPLTIFAVSFFWH